MSEQLIESPPEVEKWVNIQVDSQIFSTFMSCPRKCDYVFNRHLIPIGGMSKSIEKGLLSHIGLHAYWKSRITGEDYQKASIDGLEAAKADSLTHKNLQSEDALDVFQNLIAYFKFIQNSHWIPVAVEQAFKFIAYEDKELKIRIILAGRIDLIVKTLQIPLIPIDNKTEAERWFHSVMSNQFKIYALACKVNVLGVQRIGFQKTLKDEEKFKMELLSFDPDMLEEFRTETLPYYCKQMLLCEEEKYWPMNTTSCHHGHFSCQFSDKYNGGICSVSRNVREQKLSRYFTVGEEWNPLVV